MIVAATDTFVCGAHHAASTGFFRAADSPLIAPMHGRKPRRKLADASSGWSLTGGLFRSGFPQAAAYAMRPRFRNSIRSMHRQACAAASLPCIRRNQDCRRP